MSEFHLVELFQQFLEGLEREHPDFVQREIYFLAKNCADEGLDAHVPLYPLFLSAKIGRRYERFAANVHDALERILEVLVDPRHPLGPRMRQHLAVTPQIEEILSTRPRGGIVPRVVRPDTVLHGDRILAHEFNVSWPGGISDSDIIADQLFQNGLFLTFAGMLEQRGQRIPRPRPSTSTQLLLEQVLAAAEDPHPFIAVVIPTPDVSPFGGDEVPLSRRIVDTFVEQGHDAVLVHPHEVEYDGEPRVRGRKLDVVYRIFEWGHVMGKHREDYRPLLAAYGDGKLPVVNSFHSEAVSAKSIFELLHSKELRWCFEDMAIDELLECIPFTANLGQLDELESVLDEKERWVLKRIKGSASDSVALGIETSEETWRRLVTEGLEKGNVVAQEYIDSPMMLMTMLPGDRLEQVPRYVDIDPFCFSGVLGNFFGRFSTTRMTSFVGAGGGMFPIVVAGE